ncbi:Methyltransferase domain-containing protein [Lutibacter oricola]|uniref:Methyltransferase domain-containing protein n=1 Tax=Lutibacter oricola TaxID=762486 RepID=A0A1H2QN20_9FLAO|nr:class I SAM-dependent methyltransferase [Lutibacter oricola]SDW08054.1 Methyltransferase domain-containing protein [Lutibacter oricola]
MKYQNSVYLKLKDYSVSKENFELIYNSELELLETSPKPTLQKLPSYYESEDYISHTDAKESLVDKVYQFVKGIALKNKLKLINSFNLEEKNMLDVGCGTGEFLLTCKNNQWNVVGVEPNKNARDLAIGKLDKNTSVNIFADIDELISQKFDVITMWHVLEHVPNLDEYILKLKQLLKPNGVLIVAVPNYKSFDALHYKQYWAAFDVPRHLWHFSQNSISILFSKVNLKVVKTLPMYFDSFYVSLLSEKYKSGSGNIVKAFFTGLRSNLKAASTKEYSSLIYVLKSSEN